MSKFNIEELEKLEYSKVLPCIKEKSGFIYSDKNKKRDEFWQSVIPIKWFDELVNESFLDDFLFGYFSKNENANVKFLQCLIDSNKKSDLIRIIKLTEAFQKELHWQSFLIFKKDIRFKAFYRELQYIKDSSEHWKSESIYFIELLKQFDFEDILIQTTSYFERFKRYSPNSMGNRTIITSYETVLINILNDIFTIKKEALIETKTSVTNKYNSNEFQKEKAIQLPPIRRAISFDNPYLIPNEDVSKKKKIFREIIDFLFAKYNHEYHIQKYLTGLADFELIDDLEAELKTNHNYIKYRKTLEKGTYDETYFSNRVSNDNKKAKEINSLPTLWEKEFKLSNYKSIEYLEYLHIPLIIKDRHTKKPIDLKKVLLILKTFSDFLKPQGRMFMNGEHVMKRELPVKFQELFHSEYIVSYNEDELIDKCCSYFSWPKEEIEAIIKFLTTDLSSSRKFKVNFLLRPLIKIGKQYIWASSFLKERRWEILLHQRILADDRKNQKNLDSQSSKTEQFITNIFKEGGFNSISNHKYTHNTLMGEIDVLAFKDNTLFIIELKSTAVEEDMIKTTKYEVLKFNSKASEQLSRAKRYILDRFEEIKTTDGLNINCNKNDLKIITLIVSNIYQSDDLIFKNEHLKISLFELLIILKNDLYNMLVSKASKCLLGSDFDIPVDVALNAGNLQKTKKYDVNKENCNLWEDKKNCSPTDLISAIKENKVWKHQDTHEIFTPEEIGLNTFDKDKKYLS